MVLVHGGGAHSRWWDHIAPIIATDYRVIAVDLSGHGDSDRRSDYDLSLWAAEVIALSRAGGAVGRPVVVGHSMGGWVALTVGAEYPDQVAGVVAIDSPISSPAPEERAASRRLAFGPLRHYESPDDAIARFRVVPEDPFIQPYLIAHLAQTSIVRRGEGWTWKFDPDVFVRSHRPSPGLLRMIRCRVALFRAEFGMVTTDIGREMYEMLGRAAPVITLPQAGHHAFLDEPIATVAGLRTLLADWRHSEPRHR